MALLNELLFQVSAHTENKRQSASTSFRTVGAVLLVLGVILSWLGIATAQPGPIDLQSTKESLEVQKLTLEVAKLRDAHAEWLPWLTAGLGILTGAVGTAAPFLLARRARLGALDQSVHEKRLESYPQLVKATQGLALFFPCGGSPAASVDPPQCFAMGRAMSEWYFAGGGLLLSVKARNAYFSLARALTRASLVEGLKVPTFPQDSKDVSLEKIDEYRKQLNLQKITHDDIEKWTFGSLGSETTDSDRELHKKFKDYVFLQQLSSTLRTSLTEDLRSRRGPS